MKKLFVLVMMMMGALVSGDELTPKASSALKIREAQIEKAKKIYDLTNVSTYSLPFPFPLPHFPNQ